MKIIQISTDYITLGQFLKYVGIIDSGAMAKTFLESEKVYVNNEIENRRGRKLYNGFEVLIQTEKYIIRK